MLDTSSLGSLVECSTIKTFSPHLCFYLLLLLSDPKLDVFWLALASISSSTLPSDVVVGTEQAPSTIQGVLENGLIRLGIKLNWIATRGWVGDGHFADGI